jgi:hypothetical protein
MAPSTACRSSGTLYRLGVVAGTGTAGLQSDEVCHRSFAGGSASTPTLSRDGRLIAGMVRRMPTRDRTPKTVRTPVDDLRGATRLAIEATRGVTDLVEAMHHNIGGGPSILGRPLEGPTRRCTSRRTGASSRRCSSGWSPRGPRPSTTW